MAQPQTEPHRAAAQCGKDGNRAEQKAKGRLKQEQTQIHTGLVPKAFAQAFPGIKAHTLHLPENPAGELEKDLLQGIGVFVIGHGIICVTDPGALQRGSCGQLKVLRDRYHGKSVLRYPLAGDGPPGPVYGGVLP